VEGVTMFAVSVIFEIKPGAMDSFLPLMQANAEASLRDEAECLQFDVCMDEERPNEVFLYEVYTNSAAFDHHLKAPHFKHFSQAVAPMINNRNIQTYSKVMR
jgi:quinol monooxygenase YgiN